MLAARREPTFGDVSTPDVGDAVALRPAVQSSRLSRWVNVFQLFGSLLAVPVGLGSAYSLYRANFSTDTTCQSLRASIVSMLDKNVDVSTRRVLVRRDVQAFEQNCAAVDPEASKAFKAVLAEAQPATAWPAAAAPKVEQDKTPAKEVAHKVEPRQQQQQTAKPAPAPAAADSARREATDAQWLDAVRQAMATRETEPAEKPKALEAAPVLSPTPGTASTPSAAQVSPSATTEATAAPAPLGAPITLAPPAPIAAAVSEPDHPVPPGAIPDAAEVAAAKREEPKSRLGRWVAHVPLLGPIWQNR